MSRARHHEKKKAMGGGVKPEWNAGGTQNAAKEAEEKKHGGKVHHMHGGKVHHMHGEGEEPKHRHDRSSRERGGKVPGRARGGGIGADKKPLTEAAKVKRVTKDETPIEGVPSN